MTHRLFIAIAVPAQEVIALQGRLDRLRLPVDWEKPEKLHLTLNFLGRVPDSQIGALSAVVSQIARSFPPLTLRPTFLEALYRRHDRSLVYLAPTGDIASLKELQKTLSQSMATHLSLPSQERFLPHIVVGKIKKDDPVQVKKVISQVSDYEMEPLSPFVVDRLTLYESHLSRSGSTYQIKASFVVQSPPA